MQMKTMKLTTSVSGIPMTSGQRMGLGLHRFASRKAGWVSAMFSGVIAVQAARAIDIEPGSKPVLGCAKRDRWERSDFFWHYRWHMVTQEPFSASR